MEVVELVPCARNKWGNWWDFWFYVSEGEVEGHPGLPVAVMCSIIMWRTCNLRWQMMMKMKEKMIDLIQWMRFKKCSMLLKISE